MGLPNIYHAEAGQQSVDGQSTDRACRTTGSKRPAALDQLDLRGIARSVIVGPIANNPPKPEGDEKTDYSIAEHDVTSTAAVDLLDRLWIDRLQDEAIESLDLDAR